MTPFPDFTQEEYRAFLISKGENPDATHMTEAWKSIEALPPNVRNRYCEVDGHADPDHSGFCIYCDKEL